MSPKRNYEQIMGIWLNEPMSSYPEEIDRAINDLADAGYEIVRLFLRNTNYTHRSPEFVAAVRRAVDVAHKRKMRAALDCEPHELVGRDMIGQFPDAMASKLVRYSTRVVDGHWTVRAEHPSQASYLDGIEAAFLRVDGEVKPVEAECTMSRNSQGYRLGYIHRELIYEEGRPISFHREYEMLGDMGAAVNGELILYLRFPVRDLTDFWAEGFRSYFDDLLECFRDIPLDGVGWDEPAVDGDWNSYRYGSAFAKAFRERNGYELRDRLWLLDEPGLSPKSVKVRLDYYETLNEGTTRAQGNLIAKARSLFGPDILLGTHHTWQGEAGINDYRAGAVDYFRLNDNMDAGYTDCDWWDPPVVNYAYLLGSSLGRLTPSGEAEVNTWHYKPTVSNVRRNVNLMTLLNITWFNIWYSKECDCVRQQGHYTWPETVAAAHRHQEFQRRIGKRRPVIDVAIWHGWEGLCALNRADIAYAQKSFCVNTSDLFVRRNIAADFIDSRLLASSEVKENRLVNALGSYRVLVIPYGLVMPRKAYETCAAFAKAGGRVVFVATPVAADENGESLGESFSQLTGMPAMTAEHYLAGVDAVCTLPAHRVRRLEVCRALPAGLPGLRISAEGERHGVSSTDGNAIFLTDLDPQERLIECIADALAEDVRSYGDNLLWRLYEDALMVVAREDRPADGMIRWEGKLIEVAGGSAGIFEKRNGAVSMFGDLIWKEVG